MGAAKKQRGPRQWKDGGCFSTIRGERRNIVVEDESGQEVVRVPDADDAALVISAPEMLEALKKAQRFLDAIYRERPLIPDLLVKSLQETEQAVRGAISKARGES